MFNNKQQRVVNAVHQLFENHQGQYHHQNKQNRECIIQRKQKIQLSESTPHWQRDSEKVEFEKMMGGSTPLSSRAVVNMDHISQLLGMKRKKEIINKSPDKLKEQQSIDQIKQFKKQSTKLCLNCQKFISSEEIQDHQKQCQGFQGLLSYSRSQLLHLIISKILANEMELAQKRQTHQCKDSLTACQQKIVHLVKMKLRLESKIKLNK